MFTGELKSDFMENDKLSPEEKCLRANVITIALNYLLSEGLTTLEYNPASIIGNCLKEMQFDGIKLFIMCLVTPSSQLSISVHGKDIDDDTHKHYCFKMHGIVQRRTEKYIMDLPYPEFKHNHCEIYDDEINKMDHQSKLIMNSWLDKYKIIDVKPKGFEKHGEFVIF